MNERNLFILANGFGPANTKGRKFARALLPRDGNTGAWDGYSGFIYSNEEESFAAAYDNLLNNISAIFKTANFKVNILHKRCSLPDVF